MSTTSELPVYAVIMAGGSGTRFWPASRQSRPKQLLPLVTANQSKAISKSLLRETVDRIRPLVRPEHVMVVTAESLAEQTHWELPEVNASNVLKEPAPRNTAPCIAWATQEVLTRHEDAILMVLASDSYIAQPEPFLRCVEQAVAAAHTHELATIGIQPTRPETGFGYIELSEESANGVHRVIRFVEKPNLEKAKEFVSSQHFLWNSGMFFFRASRMQAALEKHQPVIADGIASMYNGQSLLRDTFPRLPSISIDYAVVEPISRTPDAIAVVRGDFGWSDVGSWHTAWELALKDAEENAVPSDAVLIDARGNLARVPSGKTVALLGVNDLIVVETEDALLVMPRERSQDVRLVVDALKARGRTDRV